MFRIDSEGETILHTFSGPPAGGGDGAYSYYGVIRDAIGNLYGATTAGGTYGAGAVYKLDTTGDETLLYSFSGGADGAVPASVVLDSQGNLYGTSGFGGNLNCAGGSGCGVIFKLSPQPGGTWKETTLYTFCSLPNCTDGESPGAGPLVLDTTGNLYGTTSRGGSAYRNCEGNGCGVVFKLDTSAKETVLYSFTSGADGGDPSAGLTMGKAGDLYGTAELGGDTACFPPYGCGTVFELTP